MAALGGIQAFIANAGQHLLYVYLRKQRLISIIISIIIITFLLLFWTRESSVW